MNKGLKGGRSEINHLQSHKSMVIMKLSRNTLITVGLIAVAASATATRVSISDARVEQKNELQSSVQKASPSLHFTFTAFGDAGWADTHISRPKYTKGFKNAFQRFNRKKETLGDINYINWETSVGTQCDQFWAKQTPSTFAFLTHPQELVDAINLGFNMIGLANNHTFDCIRSKEGNGPIQSYNFVKSLKTMHPNIVFSGIFSKANEEPAKKDIVLKQGIVPITFLSAYVGGNKSHCSNMSCAINITKSKKVFEDKKRLRVLALHSWNQGSHQNLKKILRQWVQSNLVDIAIGSGPHIAESIEIIDTNHGKKVLATSLGNFIHPSLSAQPYNVVLQTEWKLDATNQEPILISANAIKASCDGGSCINTGTIKLD